uniref:Uncharacterized protein n=1 Tax=Anguilla anguilla TaxID=7936 RepID=A0A0E9WYN9_ANGAN
MAANLLLQFPGHGRRSRGIQVQTGFSARCSLVCR